MALLYGVPLVLGSVGTYFAGSMFDETEESTTTPTDSAASILSPQSTETAPGGSANVNVSGAPNTNTSSFMPSINITTPSFMGGPAQQPQQSSWFGGPARPQSSWFGGPTYPPQQQQSSWFGGPAAPPQQQSSFFGGPVAAPPQQQSSFFGGPVAAPPAPTAVINSIPLNPELSGDSVLKTVESAAPEVKGPSVLETADMSGPTGPSAMDEFLASAQAAKNSITNSAGENTALQPFVDEANKQIDDLTKHTGINALPEAQAALESIIGKFNEAVKAATPPPPPPTAPPSTDQAAVVPVEQPQAVTVADVPVAEPVMQTQSPQQAMTETVPEAVPPPEPEPEAQAEALPETVVAPSPTEPEAPRTMIPPSLVADNPFKDMTAEQIQQLAREETPPAAPQPEPEAATEGPTEAATEAAPSDIPVLISLSARPSVNEVNAFFNQQYMKSEKIEEQNKQSALNETKQSLNDFISESNGSPESLNASKKFNALEKTFIKERISRLAKREAYLKNISTKEASAAAAAAAKSAQLERQVRKATTRVGERGDGIPLDLKIRAKPGFFGTSNVPTFAVNEFFNQPFLTAAPGDAIGPNLLGPETSQEKLIAEAEEHFVIDPVAKMNTKERVKFVSMLQKWRADKPKREQLRKDYYNSLIQAGVSADEAQSEAYGPPAPAPPTEEPPVVPTEKEKLDGGNRKTRNNRRPNRWTYRRKH